MLSPKNKTAIVKIILCRHITILKYLKIGYF